MTGRVAERGHKHQRGDTAGCACLLERFDENALSVGGQAPQAEAEHVGKSDDAVVGEAFGQHDLAGLDDGGDGQEQAMGSAVGDEDAVLLGVDAESLNQTCAASR